MSFAPAVREHEGQVVRVQREVQASVDGVDVTDFGVGLAGEEGGVVVLDVGEGEGEAGRVLAHKGLDERVDDGGCGYGAGLRPLALGCDAGDFWVGAGSVR